MCCPSCHKLLRDPATIVTGRDRRLLPLTDTEIELAEHVGAVIIAAGALDAAVGALSGAIRERDPQRVLAAWGHSGSQLAEILRKQAGQAGETTSTPDHEVLTILDRYEKLYEIRNRVVHSFRVLDEGAGRLDQALQMVRGTKKQPPSPPHEMIIERSLGISELIDLWYEIDALTHDARKVFLDRTIDGIRGVT